MKIQCSCGTKYSFDLTPEMANSPIRFVCQNCGADSSTLVNQLIRQQLGLGAPAVAPPPAIAPPPAVAAKSTAPSAPVAPVIRVTTPAPAQAAAPAASVASPAGNAEPLRVSAHAASAAAAAPAPDAPQVCTRHVGHLTTHRCLVCQKPICPQCMQLFGFVCSAYCKGKAESQGMDLPVYAGQREVVQSRQWRKVSAIALSAFAAVGLVLGAWGWYAWVGSVPKVAFSARMTAPGYSGQVRVCAQDQVVFLHGGTLARHDMKAKKELWSNVLIDKKSIAEEATAEYERVKSAREKVRAEGGDLSEMRFVTREELVDALERNAAAALHLHMRGKSIWVTSPGRLTRYDWQTGKPGQETPLPAHAEEPMAAGDELLFKAEDETGRQSITRINLASGESRLEEISPASSSAAAVKSSATGRPEQNAVRRTGTNQASSVASAKTAKPLDPAAVATRVQNMPRPARLALPAVVAANANQQRLMAEMRDQPPPNAAPPVPPAGSFAPEDQRPRVIITPDGAIRLSSRLLETRIVERKVMKEPPKKSALDGPVNQAATAAIANELLNEIQRDRGGDVVKEDVSRYQVTLRRAGGKDAAEWTGEAGGWPDLIPLQTVNVVVGGRSVVVLDKGLKKLWEASLNFDLGSRSMPGPDGEHPPDGEGPCVERSDTLYIYDRGVLTAFELASGTVRWRLPSVDTKGLFFDDQGMIYVNTTSATPDNIKYSNQIDVTDKIHPVVLKVEPRTGKTLWRANNDGSVNYVSGKLVYTAESYQGDDDDADGLLGVDTVFHVPAHIRIKRLDASNGRVLWQHYQKRCPLDVRYDRNSIHLLFKKEVQVLKFILL